MVLEDIMWYKYKKSCTYFYYMYNISVTGYNITIFPLKSVFVCPYNHTEGHARQTSEEVGSNGCPTQTVSWLVYLEKKT